MPVLVWKEAASKYRLDAQNIQEIGGNARSVHDLRLTASRERQVLQWSDGSQFAERVRRRLHFLESHLVERLVWYVAPWDRQHKTHQPVRITVLQRLQEHRANHAEHGRVGADAEGESEDDHGRKPRVLAQRPQAIAHILNNGFHEAPWPLLTALLASPFDPSERDCSLPPCLFRWHASGHVRLGQMLEVKPQLVIYFGLCLGRNQKT